MWTLFLTIYCVELASGPCPPHTEIAEPAWNITTPQTYAQCEEHRALILWQQPLPDNPRGFVLDAVCLADGAPTAAPTNVRLRK